MTADVSFIALRAAAYVAIVAAWVASIRWLWLSTSGRGERASMGWRLPLAGLMLALATVARATYRLVSTEPIEIVWATQLTQLAYLLIALAFPFAIALFEIENGRP